jgi:hypothetical protein
MRSQQSMEVETTWLTWCFPVASKPDLISMTILEEALACLRMTLAAIFCLHLGEFVVGPPPTQYAT